MAATLAIAVESCLTNHIFQQGNQFYLQPYLEVIGLDLMRCVAELYMTRWLNKFTAKLQNLSEQSIPIINKEAESCAKNIIDEILDVLEKKTTFDNIIDHILDKVGS